MTASQEREVDVVRGRLAVAGRAGNERLWDIALAERLSAGGGPFADNQKEPPDE